MINFFKTWCENIIVSIIICIIIEMILPEGKNKKYVQVIIGIYIIFTILNPIFLNLSKEIDLKNLLETEKSIDTFSYEKNNKISKIYVEAMKNDIKNEITKMGFKVNYIELKFDERYEKIEKIIISVYKNLNEKQKNEEILDKKIVINEIKINNNTDIEENNINEEDKKNIKNKILEMYEIEEKSIEIN